MNNEIEIKVIIDNPTEVETILLTFAKSKSECSRQTDIYYIMPNCNFFKEIPVTRYLRLRINENRKASFDYHLCHLNNDGHLLFTSEFETEISDPTAMIEICNKIGLVKYVEVIKNRKEFLVENFKITIDKIESLGTFMEIEYSNIFDGNENKVDSIKKQCFELLEKCGAKWTPAPKLGYPDMILAQKLELNSSI